jgi:septation ring formation regulator EzrA
MTDEPENIVPVMLRRLDTKFDGMRDEFREIKGRLTNVETVLAAVATELGSLVGADARIRHSIDRLADRLERVERRLGLIDAPPLWPTVAYLDAVLTIRMRSPGREAEAGAPR